jgi:thiamine-phosphate pyrophosphorylase
MCFSGFFVVHTQVYLRVTSSEIDVPKFVELLKLDVVQCVRLDLNTQDLDQWHTVIKELFPLCCQHDVALIVCDYVNLVKEFDLDGVHLTPTGVSLAQAQKTLGQDKIIGAYAKASRHTGMTLAEHGASYISFGPVWSDPALADQPVAEIDLFEWWQDMIEVPVVAEGGVTPETAKKLLGKADFIVLDFDDCRSPDDLNTYGFV